MTTNQVKGSLDVYSEDIAEIRSCIWDAFMNVYNKGREKRRDELTEIMNLIYDRLFMDCKPIVIFDKSNMKMRSDFGY